MTDLKVVPFPTAHEAGVVDGLRNLANDIEAGEYGGVHNLVWVSDAGNGNLEVGLLGESSEPGTLAYFLMGLGMAKIQNAIKEHKDENH